MNAAQNYPVYANCFDRLTTNGVIAEDLVGYVTGTPSPYLQNYVAQRGWTPTLPGQILPDPLPTAPQPAPMSVEGYNNIPKASELNKNTFAPKHKYEKAQKIALSILLTGLAALGIVKGRKLVKTKGAPVKNALNNALTGTVNFCKNGFRKIGNCIKNGWNKIFHKTP